MASDSLRVSDLIPARPEEVYVAWLDSDSHSAMTGGTADIAATVGTRFTAWDGYIEGTTLELEPGRRIVQAWRTSEFPLNSPDSRLEVLFEAREGGTHIVIAHSEIPEGQGPQYEEGWRAHYFVPMKEYFGKAAAKKAPAKKSKPAKKAAKSTASRKKAPAKKKAAPKAKKTRGRTRR